MSRFFKFKRLKIAEQIIIVLFFAVIIPTTISAIIINNINQQSMRTQFRNSALLIANMVSEEIDVFQNVSTNELNQIAISLDNINIPTEEYLKKIQKAFPFYDNLEIIESRATIEEMKDELKQQNKVLLHVKTPQNNYLVATYKIETLRNSLFKSLNDDSRQIYVLDDEGYLLAAYNYNKDTYNKSVALMPPNPAIDVATIFGDIKNQPYAYIKKSNPQLTVIVNTAPHITQKFINRNSAKIILSVLIASLSIIFVVLLYTYYLYINIRQLFKGIIAISKGNYKRKIRLLANLFTPHEIVFLTYEFNRMANQIHQSDIVMKKKNKELKQLNEFRSNLIDTVSHELRTPLTSIQGYTSRLMRQDIQIDEETKQKSLRVIKNQTERLKRMIEDLLVIPDIEGSRIHVNIEEISPSAVIINSITLLKNNENKEIISELDENFPNIYADLDRFEQVMVNLLENAVKYSNENSQIKVEGTYTSDTVKIFVKNDCDIIPKDKLKTLFDKFTRIDDKTTRTTRGTGLGLFIVKGLVETMNGSIKLSSNKDCGFCVELKFPKVKDDV